MSLKFDSLIAQLEKLLLLLTENIKISGDNYIYPYLFILLLLFLGGGGGQMGTVKVYTKHMIEKPNLPA